MKLLLLVGGLLATLPALAEDPVESQSEDIYGRTIVTQKEVQPSGFANEEFGFRPQAGIVNRNNLGDSSVKAIFGLLMDINVVRAPPLQEGRPYVAFGFGALYSHLGNPNSDFIGLGGTGGDEGTNFLELPVNAKAGYTFNEVFRMTVHGGLNVLYSHTTLAAVAPATPASTSTWNGFGNIGADFEFAVGKNVAVLLRPDWTFAAGDTFFTGTFGVDLPIS